MSSRTAARSCAVQSRNRLSKRSWHSRSIQARPPRIGVCRSARPVWSAGSAIMKSMNSGTPASVALPDRASFGMMMSTSTRTVAYSCAVKNFGLKSAGRAPAGALRAACAALAASASVQVNPAASGTDPSSPSIDRRFSLVMLDRALLALVGDVRARAHRERQDGPRAVLVRLRRERAAVGDEHVLRVVRLAVPVQDRRARIVPHARDAELVDDPPAGRQPVLVLFR